MTDQKPRTTADILRDAQARASQHMTAPATATKAAAKVETQKATQTQRQEEVSTAEDTAIELHIAENPFYKTLTDVSTSQEDKISAIANALNPKLHTMEETRENFKLFQQYYTYVQSEDLDAALEGVERLIKELQSNTKIEIGGILKNLQGMLSDIDVSRQLVEVMRKARLAGQTVPELVEAFKRNEEIVARLGELEKQKAKAAAEVEASNKIVAGRITDRDAKEGTWSHWGKSLIKKDTTFSDRVVEAQTFAQNKEAALAAIDAKIADLTAVRNKELEEGPLQILRSIDETDDSLSKRLISSGRNGISTIQGAQKSVVQLFTRVSNSEAGINEIGRRVADKQISLTVLQSGLLQASENTEDKKKTMESIGDEAEKALAAAEAPADGKPSILKVTNTRTKALEIKRDLGEVIEYQGSLNETIAEMNTTLAKNIDRQGKTDSGKKIILGTKKSVTILGRDALNTVAGNLETVLTSLVADQNDEMNQVVVQFSTAANQMEKGIVEGMKVRAGEMHVKNMEYLDETIKRLKDGSKAIAETLETAVTEGIELADKQREIKAASAELENATTTMRKVTGAMSNDSVLGAAPSRPDAEVPEAAPASPPVP